MELEHPVVTAIRRHGYPEPEPEPIGEDFFGNQIYPGDDILVFEDHVFLLDELGYQAIEILRALGAEETTA